MIAAVTGGTGFIGAKLLERLLSGPTFSEVRVLTRGKAIAPRARSFTGDLLSDPLEAFVDGADVVFHCAGELRREQAMRGLHVDGTRRLIGAARGRISRWVQLSSVGAYGRALREGVVDEDSALAPRGEYEATKAASDELVGRAAGEGAFAAAVLRPSIVFGPGMPNRSLAQLVSAVDRGLFFFVGQGALANYVYVDDVADALFTCGRDVRAHGAYILSDDRSMEAFIGEIARQLGKPAPSRRLPELPARMLARTLGALPVFPLALSRVDALSRCVRYPSTRITQELGYRFGVSIEEGLRRFIAHWRAQR